MGKYQVDDERNDLIYDFLRLALDLSPKVIMMKNVPGLSKDQRFIHFRDTLQNEGYFCSYNILNASDYGVPQRRKRLIFIASKTKPYTYPETPESKQTVRDTIFNLAEPGFSNDPLHDLPEKRCKRILDMFRKIPKDGGSRTALKEDEKLECHKDFTGFIDVYGRMKWDDVSPTITGGA